MSLSIKNASDANSPDKPGAPSPRSNPVCLELGVTIRSLPNEAAGLTHPIREEGKTVIVFDNGAVIRSGNNLPVGQTFILSNPNGRDVVCKVVGGRNLPSVKGYVEVEFLEPAKDFWSTQKEGGSAPVAAPPAPSFTTREASLPQPPVPPRVVAPVVAPVESPAKPVNVPHGSAPSFEDIPGLLSVPTSAAIREPKISSPRPGPARITKDESSYNSDNSKPTSLANWDPPEASLPTEKRAMQAMREALSTSPTISAPPRDFMSKGLMAYEQPQSSPASSKRMPLILGGAAIVLAAVGGAIFWMHQGTSTVSMAKADVASQASTAQSQAATSMPAHNQNPQVEPAQSQTRTPAQSVAVNQGQQPASAIAPVPAVVTSAAPADARAEQANVRRQDDNAVSPKQASAPSARRPAIPNLKIGAPTAPSQNSANLAEGAAPLTEIASTEAMGGAPAASFLTAAGRTSTAPAPPPSAPAPPPEPVSKVVRDPKLISSTKPVYPATARQTGVQGTVSVRVYIDENGKVTTARALGGPMLLRQAAVDSVKQWKYSPGTEDGKPASSQITVGVDFRLN